MQTKTKTNPRLTAEQLEAAMEQCAHEVKAKVNKFAGEITDYIVHAATAQKLEPHEVAIATLQVASICLIPLLQTSRDPYNTYADFLGYFGAAVMRNYQKSMVGVITREDLMQCLKEFSSAESPADSASTSSESPSSQSGESDV